MKRVPWHTPRRGTLIGLILPVCAIVLFAGLLIFSLVRLAAVEDGMRIGASPNMLWVNSRAQVATLRVGSAVAKRMTGQIDQAALEQSYHIFESRLHLLGQGPQRRRMEAFGLADRLDRLWQRLPELRQLIIHFKPGEPAETQRIHALLDAFNQLFGRASNKAMVTEWDDLGDQLDTARSELWQIIISLIGIALAGAVISFHFLLATRRANRRTRLLDAAQREIAQHRDHLEEVVKSRTRALEAALERERTTAELYRNFGTMISHQFRTPLAVVDSSLQRLMRRSERVTAREIRERGATARDAIARLIKLVESTLDAAHLDAGHIKIRLQPCDLGSLVRQVCAAYSEQAAHRHITLELPEGESGIAYCDPSHAEHIFTNLLSNALKYSTTGTKIRVAVSTNGNQVECAVSNHDGSTFPVDTSTLFERYYRGQNAEGHPGIGIGLYMGRALARMQAGDVRLTKADGEWVTFTLSLPRAHRNMPNKDAESQREVPA